MLRYLERGRTFQLGKGSPQNDGLLTPARYQATLRIWILGSVAIALALSLVGSADAQNSVASAPNQTTHVFPLIYDPPALPVPVVAVRIGSSKPMLFVVDTGCNAPVVLASWAAREIQWGSGAGDTEVAIKDGDKAYVQRTLKFDLKFDVLGADGSTNAEIPVNTVICAADDQELTDVLYRTPHLAGILGTSFWSARVLRFDFVQKTMTISGTYSASAPPANIAAISDLPMPESPESSWAETRPLPDGDGESDFQVRLIAPRDATSGTTATAKLATADQWLVVDTGFDGTCIPAVLQSLYPTAGNVMSEALLEHKEKTDAQKSTVTSMTLGPALTEPNIEVAWIGSSATPNLGMNFLRRFLVTIDLQKNKMYLQRASNYGMASRGSGFFGLRMGQNALGQLIVSECPETRYVAPKDIRLGDEIVEVDGYDVRDYSLTQVGALDDGYRNTAACLMVRHPGDKTAHAVWIARPDAGRATHTGSDQPTPTVRLRGGNVCTVTNSIGVITRMPYEGNPATQITVEPPQGFYYQRVQRADGSFGWEITRDDSADRKN